MRNLVFDSHAILKFSQNEAGSDKVEALLTASQEGESRAYMSEINLGEIYYITIRKMGLDPAMEFLEHLHALPIEMVAATWDIIASASEMKGKHPLSYADCFAVATALRHKAAIVTGDPEFKHVEHLIEIEWI